jgi:hypothetical protein
MTASAACISAATREMGRPLHTTRYIQGNASACTTRFGQWSVAYSRPAKSEPCRFTSMHGYFDLR